MMKPLKNTQGFSLLELLVAMAVFSMIIAAIMTSRTDQQIQNVTQIQAAEMQQSARAVMFMMKRDIRKAGFNSLASGSASAGITVAQTSTLAYTYIDTANLNTLTTETYTLADHDLDTVVDDITRDNFLVAENIQNLTFRYFDGTSPVPNEILAPVANTNLANIRSIEISITAGIDTDELARAGANNRNRTLTSTVFLRNMGL